MGGPLQKPHPRVWIPAGEQRSHRVGGRQRYPYIALSTAIDATKKIWELYDSSPVEAGIPRGRRIAATCSGATSPRRREGDGQARSSCGCRAIHGLPIRCGRARRLLFALVPQGVRRVRGGPSLESPRSCLRGPDPRSADHRRDAEDGHHEARRLLEETRPSSRLLDERWLCQQRGREELHTPARPGMLPAVREMGKELALWSPFEANAPVASPTRRGRAPAAA